MKLIITSTVLGLSILGIGCSSAKDRAEIQALRAKLTDARKSYRQSLDQEVASNKTSDDMLGAFGPVLDEAERSFSAKKDKGGLEKIAVIREYIAKSKAHHADMAKMAAELTAKLDQMESLEK